MKRFINIATAAALTASMICVPTAIVVSAAETASFEVCMPDQVLESGKKSVTIPVSFDEDITFSSLQMKFASKFTSPSRCTVSIASVKSALPDTSGVSVTLGSNSDVKVSSSKDFTLKKGTVLFNITVELGNLIQNTDGTEKWPIGASFRFSMSEFTMTTADKKETQLSSDALVRANSVVQVIPTAKTEGMSISIGSVKSSSNVVDVPVLVTGSMMTFTTQFKVDNGAKITNIKKSDKTNLDISYNQDSVYAKALWVNKENKNVVFDNSEVAILTVTLPADAKESDIFTVSFSSFDPASEDTNLTLYPSSIKSGEKTYTPSGAKGSVLSDVKVSTPYVVSKTQKANLNDLKITATITDKDGVKSTIEIPNVADNFKVVEETGTFDRTLKLEYTGTLYTCTDPVTVSYLTGLLGDINLDGKVDTRDETTSTKEYMAQSFGETYLKGALEQKTTLKSVIDKYSIDTVTKFASSLGDVDSNGKIDTRDATWQIKYYNANAFEDVSWDTVLGIK